MSAVEQLKCRAQSLQQQVLALEKDVDRVKEAAGEGMGLPSHHIALTPMCFDTRHGYVYFPVASGGAT